MPSLQGPSQACSEAQQPGGRHNPSDLSLCIIEVDTHTFFKKKFYLLVSLCTTLSLPLCTCTALLLQRCPVCQCDFPVSPVIQISWLCLGILK